VLIGIHYMRGVAALMVVAFHAISFMVIYKSYSSPFAHHVLAAGVDVFFVISGYLMVKTTEKYKKHTLDWRLFLYKRLSRIAPMYWLITVFISLAILYKPGLSDKHIDLELVLKSLLFLPSKISNSDVQSTILPVGWTLVYEMFFYIAFAAFTAFNYRAGLFLLIAAFSVFSLCHATFDNYYLGLYSDPIILEFVFGMLVAKLPTPSSPKGFVFVVVGFIALVLGAWLDGPQLSVRPLSAGVGAAIIIYGASGIKLQSVLRVPEMLGDISYTLYLTHMYTIKAGSKFLSPTFFSCIILMVVSIVVAYVAYRIIEAPLQSLVGKVMTKSDFVLKVRA
jgi:exopolysaccharide production protein ExoZ